MPTQKELVQRATVRRALEEALSKKYTQLCMDRKERKRRAREVAQRSIETDAHRWARSFSSLEKDFSVQELHDLIYRLRIRLHPLLQDSERRTKQRRKSELAVYENRLR